MLGGGISHAESSLLSKNTHQAGHRYVIVLLIYSGSWFDSSLDWPEERQHTVEQFHVVLSLIHGEKEQHLSVKAFVQVFALTVFQHTHFFSTGGP